MEIYDTAMDVAFDLYNENHHSFISNGTNFTDPLSDQDGSNWTGEENPFKIASFICSIGIIAVAFLGSTANFFTAYVFSRPSVTSSISILLAGLAIIDVLLLTTAGPIFAANALFTYWQGFALLNFISYSTVYLYPLASIFQTSSVWILTYITVERFVAVRRPFTARTRCSSQRAWLALTAVLACSVAYNAIRFWDYSVYEIAFTDSNSHNYTLSIAWPTLRNNEDYVRIYIHWFYFTFVFAFPFSALLIFNGLVAYTIRQARQERLILSRRQSKEHATAAMMIVVVLIFLLCNSLAFVLNALEVFGISSDRVQDDARTVSNSRPISAGALKPRHSHLFYFLVDANNLSIMLHCSVNFLIYYHFNQRFRIYVAAQLRWFRQYCAWCPNCDRRKNADGCENDDVVELEEIGSRLHRLDRNLSSRTLISYLRRVSSRDHLSPTRGNSPRRVSAIAAGNASMITTQKRLSAANAFDTRRTVDATVESRGRPIVGIRHSRSIR